MYAYLSMFLRACFLLLVALHLIAQTPSPEGAIEGIAVNALNGQPIPDVLVRLSGTEAPDQATAARVPQGSKTVNGYYFGKDLLQEKTDAAGRFRFSGLGAGRYEVQPEKTGFLRPGQRGADRIFPPLRIALAAGQTFSNLQLKLLPWGVLAGAVRDPAGRPVSNSRIQVLRQVNGESGVELVEVAVASTNDLGEYRIPKLYPDAYYILAHPPNLQGSPLERTFYPGSLDLSSAGTVDLASEQERASVDITLAARSGVKVYGRLNSPIASNLKGSEKPLRPYTEISLIPSYQPHRTAGNSPGMGPSTIIQGDSFELTNVRPGRYELRAVTRQGLPIPAAGQPPVAAWASRTIEVGYGELAVDLLLVPATTIGGVATFAANPGPVDISLKAHEHTLQASTKRDGTFSIANAGPFNYRVSARGTGRYGRLVSARYGGVDVLASGLQAGGNASGRLELVMGPMEAGSVTGQVLGPGGAPAAWSTVLFWSKTTREWWGESTDQNGRFELRILPTGEHRVYAFEGQFPAGLSLEYTEYDRTLSPEALKGYERTASTLAVKAGAVTTCVVGVSGEREK
jgi:hypothetical protein